MLIIELSWEPICPRGEQTEINKQRNKIWRTTPKRLVHMVSHYFLPPNGGRYDAHYCEAVCVIRFRLAGTWRVARVPRAELQTLQRGYNTKSFFFKYWFLWLLWLPIEGYRFSLAARGSYCNTCCYNNALISPIYIIY